MDNSFWNISKSQMKQEKEWEKERNKDKSYIKNYRFYYARTLIPQFHFIISHNKSQIIENQISKYIGNI